MAKGQKKRLDTVSIRTNNMERYRGPMPVTECSARIGVDFSSWYKWERGDAFPTLPYIWRIEGLFSDLNHAPVSYRDIWPGADPSLEDLG